MNERKALKFNLVMTSVLLVLLILFLIGTTIAYFFDTKQSSAVMTSGNVKITLSEAAVKRVGDNLVPDPDQPRIFGGSGETTINDYGAIYPAQSIYKDPTVTNTGDNPEWVAVKVTLTDGDGDLTKVMGYEGYEELDIKTLLSGALLDETTHYGTWNNIPDVSYNDDFAMVQVADAAEGVYEFYFLMINPLEVGDSVVVFDHIDIPAEWNNTEMKELASLKIQIQAYGVQTTALDSCLKAMTEAFPSEFNFN